MRNWKFHELLHDKEAMKRVSFNEELKGRIQLLSS